MKATIRYTKFEGHDRRGDEGIVRVAEITHCVPMQYCSLIMLTTGGSITTPDTIEELEARIDEAEGIERDALKPTD